MKLKALLTVTLTLMSNYLYAEEKVTPLRDILKPAHSEALETAETRLRELVKVQTDGNDVAAIKELQDLLDKPRQPAPTADALIGEWNVRSIQATSYGVFSYPFFKCRIHLEGELGLVFHKNTGSQRRLGNLAADGKTRFLFAGGKYVNGESSRGYSAFLENPTADDVAHDSIGYLYQLSPKHFLLIFSERDKNGEIYELKKP